MTIRQPTKEEMVEGIALGFKRYLSNEPSYSCLSSSGINEAIKDGVKEAFADFVKIQIAIKGNDNVKKNTATDESLNLFANFITQGVDIEGLVEAYEDEVLNRLYGLTDKELLKEEKFYNYSLKQNKGLD